MEDLGILITLFGGISAVVGGWVRLNVKINSQKVEQDNLQKDFDRIEEEMKQLKESRSRIEEKLFDKLASLETKLTDFMIKVEGKLK